MQSEIAGQNKKLKIIHTADWHLGQKFYDYERVSEHECFLSWLKDIIEEREIDILLISGDIFDTSSPSTTAQEMFYNFLFRLTKIPHKVYVVIIAGNHDSAARLEAPSQLMKILNINVIGSLKKKSGDIDYKSAIVNIKSEEGDKECFIAAIPFLRQGDYPLIKDVENPYSSGIVEVYAQTYKNIIEEIKINSHSLDIPVIAMGHMHCSTASLSDSERGIRGGLEVIDNNLLEIGYDYIALGHIHKSQKIEDKDYIRYSGSPIPMSFSEINYKHKIIEIEFENKERKITEIIIPRKVDILRFGTPDNPVTKDEAFEKIKRLETITDLDNKDFYPFLEINILLDSPDLLLSNEISKSIEDKKVRLAGRRIYYNKGNKEKYVPESVEEFKELTPQQMLEKIYLKKYNIDVPENIMVLYKEIIDDIEQGKK